MNQFINGSVQVSNDVIDIIIASTALKVEGVLEVKGYDNKKKNLAKNHTKHIKTVVENGVLSTKISIIVSTEKTIIEAVEKVQRDIHNQIKSMLGLKCGDVDVMVVVK